jgi:hypothetical protein
VVLVGVFLVYLKKKILERVVFYSVRDTSRGENLKLAKKVIQNFSTSFFFEINDIIELKNIQYYFKNNLYLKDWKETEIKQYLEISRSFDPIIKSFICSIDNSNIYDYYKRVDNRYYRFFWELVVQFNKVKVINKDTFELILDFKPYLISEILLYKKIVDKFSKSICDFLLEYEGALEILVNRYEVLKDENSSKLYLPPCHKAIINDIIASYLLKPEPNLNYLKLITNSSLLKIDARLKFKSKKLSSELSAELLKKSISGQQHYEFSIYNKQKEPILLESNGNIYKVTISKEWIDRRETSKELFENFVYLTNVIDFQGCLSVVSKENEIDVFEHLRPKSIKSYPKSTIFVTKEIFFNGISRTYFTYLLLKNIQIEQVVKNYLNIISKQFEIENLSFNIPSKNTYYWEKITSLMPQIERLLKQYNCFVETGKIDFDFIEFDGTPINFGDIKSLSKRKYVYGEGKHFNQIKYLFFSKNTYLIPTEHSNTYKTFFDYIKSEEVSYCSFVDYQKLEIDEVIKMKYLFLDENDIIRIVNINKLFVFQVLFTEDVISFNRFPYEIQQEILEYVKIGVLKFECKLLTKNERKLFNYNLNSKEFTDGLNMRNKYSHGANNYSEEQQKTDYFKTITLLFLLICKISDDLHLSSIE